MDIFMLPWYDHERNTGQSFWSKFCWQTRCISSKYKHNNSKGAATRGNYEIWFLILIHSIICLLSLFVVYCDRC